MAKPVLTGYFHPQQWIFDNAVDSGPAVAFDAGRALLLLSADNFRYIVGEMTKDSGRDLDMLAEAAGLVGDGGEDVRGQSRHDGPYHVGLHPDAFARFVREIGVRDEATLSALTDEGVEKLRDQYDTKRIRISYEIWTQESIEIGEAEETGWEDEEGRICDNLYDALVFLRDDTETPLEPSSSQYSGNLWYTGQTIQDRAGLEDGENRQLSYHLVGFTEDEEKAVLEFVRNGTWPSLDLLFGAELRDVAADMVLLVGEEISGFEHRDAVANALNGLRTVLHADEPVVEDILVAGNALLVACGDLPEKIGQKASAFTDILDQAERVGFELPDDDSAPLIA